MEKIFVSIHGKKCESKGSVVLHGSVVFPEADQDVVGGEVLVPGRVEDAVSCREDPLVTDQTGSTQQLLGASLEQHHLPAERVPNL